MTKCLPLNDPNNQWPLCPSLAPAIIFAILFGLTTLYHTYQGFRYHKWYTIVIVMGGSLECGAMVDRALSIEHQTSSPLYSVWFTVLLLAPLWINAFVYMIMGRMVFNFVPSQRVACLPAWRFGMVFVVLDIGSFMVQVVGAVMVVNTSNETSELRGVHIYMIGVGIQQIIIIIFLFLAYKFHREMRQQPPTANIVAATKMLYVMYAVLLLITVRIIFRLIEYSGGFNGFIPTHEVFIFIFDCLPMLVALVLLNAVHPGWVMPGKESNIPSRKERKKGVRKDGSLLNPPVAYSSYALPDLEASGNLLKGGQQGGTTSSSPRAYVS